MIVSPIKTHKITDKDTSIEKIIDQYIDNIQERSILAITSKIVGICEGRIVPVEKADRDELVEQEADWYIPRKYNSYGFMYTITHNKLIASAGIDESNGNGYYILWPENPQRSANKIRSYITKRFKRKYVGVIITDSHTVPFSWGVVGICLAHSGFEATRNYIGTPDLFGRDLHVTHQSNTEGIAGAADVVMGGAAEAQPMALVTDIPFVEFQNRNPTQKELFAIRIEREGDLFWSIMKNAPWKKGKRGQEE